MSPTFKQDDLWTPLLQGRRFHKVSVSRHERSQGPLLSPVSKHEGLQGPLMSPRLQARGLQPHVFKHSPLKSQIFKHGGLQGPLMSPASKEGEGPWTPLLQAQRSARSLDVPVSPGLRCLLMFPHLWSWRSTMSLVVPISLGMGEGLGTQISRHGGEHHPLMSPHLWA